MKRPSPRKIIKARSKIREALLRESSMTQGWKERTCRNISRIVSGDPDYVEPAAILHYLQEPVMDFLEEMTGRIAGDMQLLYNSEYGDLWNGEEEYMMLRCNEILPWFRNNGKLLFSVYLEIMEGPSGGAVYRQVMSQNRTNRGMITWTASSAMGRKFAKPLFYDLAGMYFSADVQGSQGGINIQQVDPRSCEIDYNKKLMDSRGRGCIYGIKDKCEYCQKGWESCSLAYHPHDFFQGRCSHWSCREWGWISSVGLCTECIKKRRMAFSKKEKKQEDNNATE